MIEALTNPRHNQLLAALPEHQRQRWLPQLEHMQMSLGQVLYGLGSILGHVYVPAAVVKKEYDRLLSDELAA